jgi:hypothetical protein
MTSPEPTDTYVICYTKPGNLWTAYSIRTRQVGVGTDPKEALANGVNAADQVVGSATERNDAHLSNPARDLMLTLARIAQPLTEGACAPGVVYKYERT